MDKVYVLLSNSDVYGEVPATIRGVYEYPPFDAEDGPHAWTRDSGGTEEWWCHEHHGEGPLRYNCRLTIEAFAVQVAVHP